MPLGSLAFPCVLPDSAELFADGAPTGTVAGPGSLTDQVKRVWGIAPDLA
jgi:hypothetical protein